MAQREKVKGVIVVLLGPIGARYNFADVVDTVESIRAYASPESRIIIQDHSSPFELGKRIKAQFRDVIIVRAPKNYGLYGGLYQPESLSFLYIHQHLDPAVVIFMDTDAMFTNHGLEDAAIAYFKEHPTVGLMGNFLREGEGIEWPVQKLHKQLGWLGKLRDPERHRVLSDLVKKAHGHGWKDGEHIQGGMRIYNATLIPKMIAANMIDRAPIRRLFLANDHIYGLLCAACGMEMAHFQAPEYPFAVVWVGMPMSPQAIVEQGVAAFHSTRSWKDAEYVWNEEQIRAYFAAHRAGLTAPLPPKRSGEAAPVSAPPARGLLPIPASMRPKIFRVQFVIKRWMDIVGSAVLLVLTAPLMLVLALLIKRDSAGPALMETAHVGAKVRGKGGKRSWQSKKIYLYEFRTTQYADNVDNAAPAHTRLSGLLHRFCLHKLPLLINVFRGDLSLVGPYPATAPEVEEYSARELRRLEATPGITGWSQITRTRRTDFSQTVERDIWYAEHRTLWLDLLIVVATPFAILRGVPQETRKRVDPLSEQSPSNVPSATYR
jgi:lipopolysaccharide/colanic/teichoic acid biosynthesis glycosyltransferase